MRVLMTRKESPHDATITQKRESVGNKRKKIEQWHNGYTIGTKEVNIPAFSN